MNSSVRFGPSTLELWAICLCQFLAAAGISAQPIWILSSLKAGLISPSGAGTLASLELVMMAIGTLGVSALGSRIRPRIVLVSAALIVVTANMMTVAPSIEALAAGRLVGGLGLGAIASCVTALAARRLDALKVFALLTGAGTLGAAGVNLLLPLFVGDGGSMARLFMITAGLGAATAFLSYFGIPYATQLAASDTKASAGRGPVSLAPALACLAYVAIGVGGGSIGAYGLVIGRGLGFSVETLGQITAIALPMGLIGSVAAHRFGERAGLLRPIIICLIIVPATWLLLVRAGSPLVYGFSIASGMIAISFLGPYAMAFISRMDFTGRVMSALPAFGLFGAAAGPKIGGTVLAISHFQSLAYVGSLFFMISLALFVLSALVGRNGGFDTNRVAGL